MTASKPIPDSITDRLQEVGDVYRERRAALADATIELHRVVRAARGFGMTVRAVAKASGLSFARVHQITKELKE